MSQPTRSLTSTPMAEAPRSEDRQFLEVGQEQGEPLAHDHRTRAHRVDREGTAERRYRNQLPLLVLGRRSGGGAGGQLRSAVRCRARSSRAAPSCVAGHTDAVGSYGSNQELSERRAESVKRYLVTNFQIPAASLVTVGYGKTKLKNESDPNASANRRVQIVNMEEKAISQR